MKLTPAQKRALTDFYNHGGGMEKAQISLNRIQPKVLDKLADMGLVRWAPSGGPAKKGWWKLTPQGRALAKEL